MAEKKIGSRTFQVGHVLATDAVRLQARLLRIIGGGVDRLPTIMRGVGKDIAPELKEAANAASVAALTDIFAKCDPDEVTRLISDIVSLEAELSTRQAALESLQAQQRALADQTALATVTVTLVDEGVTVTEPVSRESPAA